MKFIRDIIVERANLAVSDTLTDAPVETGGDPQGWETPVGTPPLPDEIDPVHVTAPVGRVHSRAPRISRYEPENIGEDEEDDGFDLLGEAADTPDQQGRAEIDGQASPGRAELFADVWGRENVDKVIDDVFSDEPSYPSEAQPHSQDPFLDDDDTAHDQIAERPKGLTPDTPPPFDRIETPPAPAISTFQRFRRKQSAEAGEAQIATPDTVPASETAPHPITPVKVPAPAAGRARRQAGRVKTRLLGFGNDHNQDGDLFANGSNTNPATKAMFPVGWMVIVSGPGCGTAFALQNGVSQIGRGEGQAVRLDYGDTSISRENHAAVAYDAEQQEFFLGHGGKANLVRLNGKPVLSTETLASGALIRIGETTLRFIGFCGSEFDWSNAQADGDEDVRLG